MIATIKPRKGVGVELGVAAYDYWIFSFLG